MDPRENNLPKWAQELIRDLRRRLEEVQSPMSQELTRLRPQVQQLQARNGALTELLNCAARGGHRTAQQIVDVIGEFNLILAEE